VSLTDFVRDHPGIVSAAFGLLLSVLGILFILFWGLLKSKLEQLRDKQESQGKELEGLEVKVEHLSTEVRAVADAANSAAAREERWFGAMSQKIDEMVNRLHLLGEENIRAHGEIIAARSGLLERVAALEAKMPNGEKIVALLAELAAQRPPFRREDKAQ
jgi:septal ring factor EnvC (AmiA/AmiB activator)